MPSDSPVQPSVAGSSDLPLFSVLAGVFDKTHPTRPGWSPRARVCRGEAVRAERHPPPRSSLPGCVHVNWIICTCIAVSACSQGTPPTRCDSMCPPHGVGGDRDGSCTLLLAGPPPARPSGGCCDGCSPRTAWTGFRHRHLLGRLVPLWGPRRDRQPRACEWRWSEHSSAPAEGYPKGTGPQNLAQV